MMRFSDNVLSKRAGLLITFVLASLFVCFFYGKVIIAPNSYLFNPSGDGMKNYYTYAYYIKNNQSNIEFEGMNYPYEEHFMYTDCHPFQAFVLKKIATVFPIVTDYSIGVLNLMMLFSLIITSLVFYVLFSKLKVDVLLTTISSVGIMILSPQIFRFTGGHYALSYSFFIPFTIYILLLLSEQITIRRSVWFCVLLLIAFFTHAYLGMILFVLVFSYAGIDLLFKIIKKDRVEVIRNLQIQGLNLIPLVVFYLFIKLTDNHIGRTTNPWGIFENHAELSTVFLPTEGLLNSLKQYFFGDINQIWEGWSYVGLIGIILGILFVILSLFKATFDFKTHPFLNSLFIASLFILCFAMLLPFRSFLFSIVSELSMVKQFRALGRFAWVFFFVINIVGVYTFSFLLNKLKDKGYLKLAVALMIVVPAFIGLEGLATHKRVSNSIIQSNNLFDIEQTDQAFQEAISLLKDEDYQAIIGLPFFYIGSENFGKTATQESYKLAFLTSYHLNLPMLNSYLTRTGILESKNIMQILSQDFYQKQIQKDLKSSLPFLIVAHKDNLQADDKRLLNKGKLILEQEDYFFMEVDPKAIFNSIKSIKKEIAFYNAIKDSLIRRGNYLVNDSTLYVKSEKISNLENGVYKGKQASYNKLITINGKNLNPLKNYTARFWMQNNGTHFGQDFLNGMIFFNKTNVENGEWILPTSDARNSHQITENWSMVEVSLKNIDTTYNYELLIKGPDRSKQEYLIDDVLFYEEGLEIYLETDSNLIHNNLRIEKVN